jgi:hypothetical protein
MNVKAPIKQYNLHFAPTVAVPEANTRAEYALPGSFDKRTR